MKVGDYLMFSVFRGLPLSEPMYGRVVKLKQHEDSRIEGWVRLICGPKFKCAPDSDNNQVFEPPTDHVWAIGRRSRPSNWYETWETFSEEDLPDEFYAQMAKQALLS